MTVLTVRGTRQRTAQKPQQKPRKPASSRRSSAGGAGGAGGGSRQDILVLAGAQTARWRDDVPRLGMPGCRAPEGAFSFWVAAWPPSKSNSKELIVRRDTGKLGVATSAQVREFQVIMAQAILAELDHLGYRLEWAHQPTRPVRDIRYASAPPPPMVVNPLFGFDVEVDVVVDLYEPYRSNRDSDNILKVLFDVATLCGVFHDDVQIGDLTVRRRDHVGIRPDELVCITLRHALPSASWSFNPNGRPVSSSTSDRWIQTGRFVQRSARMPR